MSGVDTAPARWLIHPLAKRSSFLNCNELNAALLYALAAAGANLAGGLLITTASPRSPLAQRVLIAFGAGFMIATAFVGMLPHALERPSGALGVLAGYLLVHLTMTHSDDTAGAVVILEA